LTATNWLLQAQLHKATAYWWMIIAVASYDSLNWHENFKMLSPEETKDHPKPCHTKIKEHNWKHRQAVKTHIIHDMELWKLQGYTLTQKSEMKAHWENLPESCSTRIAVLKTKERGKASVLGHKLGKWSFR